MGGDRIVTLLAGGFSCSDPFFLRRKCCIYDTSHMGLTVTFPHQYSNCSAVATKRTSKH